MVSPSTSPELMHLLTESELIAPNHITRIREQVSRTKILKHDPKALAKVLVKQCVLTPYQAKLLLAGEPRGFFIGKYRILDVLGEGGMGKVFLAEQTSMKRPVALKLLELNVFTDNSIAARFYREARAGAKLRHPNITQVHDFEEDCDHCYIAMEFIEGLSLQEVVQKTGAVNYKRAANFICQAAEGLQHAHEAGLIHRDVKPGNLMVDTSGNLKVLDLGLVSIPADADPLTLHQKDIVLGTADYVAPEQAMDPHHVDIRADIYSLGAVFYFILTGTLPFPGKSIAKKLLAHQTLEPQPIRELVPEVPRKLQAIVQKMMAKDPDERFQTPGEVSRAVRAFAKSANPPYDLSLVKHTRNTIDKYLKYSGGDPASSDRMKKPANKDRSLAMPHNTPAVRTSRSEDRDAGELRTESARSERYYDDSPERDRRGNTATREKLKKKASHPARDAELEALTDTDAGPRTLAMIRAGRRPEKEFEEEYTNNRNDDRSSPRVKKKKKLNAKASKTLALCLGAVGSIVAIGVVVAGIILGTMGAGQPPVAGNPAGKHQVKQIVLGQHKNPDAIKNAIHKVRKQGRIVLRPQRGGWHADRLMIAKNRLVNKGEFTITGEGRDVVLVRRDNGPIFHINNANHFVVENVILDGQGRVGPLVEIHGQAAGVIFRNVTIRNVQGIAVKFVNAQGQPERPIRFVNTTFERIFGKGTTAVAFRSQSSGDRTIHVSFVGCRFVGSWSTAMLFGQPVDSVLVQDTVFSGSTRGIRFAPEVLERRRRDIKPIKSWKISQWWTDDEFPDFAPNQGASAQKAFNGKTVYSDSGYVDLFKHIGKAHEKSVLCYHKFNSKTPGPRRIFVGCDDEATIWVNGQKVFEHLGHQGCMPQEFTTVATFRRGVNHVWLKAKNGQSGSGFVIHVAKDYLPLTTPDWRNVTIRNNTFENIDRAITVGAPPTQETLIRVIQNQFQRPLHYPIQVLKSNTEPLRPGTVVAGNNISHHKGPYRDQASDALVSELIGLK
ncbi:MAG: serine/threonine protein kinase [Gemmataceae bacterium]